MGGTNPLTPRRHVSYDTAQEDNRSPAQDAWVAITRQPVQRYACAPHGTMRAVTTFPGRAPRRSRGMRDYASDGWRLGGAALAFVLENRALQRFVLVAAGIVVVAAAAVAVAAVALRREAGPLGYVLVGLAAYYCLSLMVTAVAVVWRVCGGQPGVAFRERRDGLAGDPAPPRTNRRLGRAGSRPGRAEQADRELDGESTRRPPARLRLEPAQLLRDPDDRAHRRLP
jgi:hypothetical protein